MPAPLRAPTLRRRARQGYAMLIALILLAVMAIVGATSLNVAGTDMRIATHNRRHMIVMNAAVAGTQHARWTLQSENPVDEGWDTGDTADLFVTQVEGENSYAGISFPMNQGSYDVDAVYQKCGNPPPGYSTEQGNTSFHADYWNMNSTARFADVDFNATNPLRAQVTEMLRVVRSGNCKIR